MFMSRSRDTPGTSTPTFPSLTDNSIRRALAGDFTSTMFSAVVTAMNSFFAELLRHHEIDPQGLASRRRAESPKA